MRRTFILLALGLGSWAARAEDACRARCLLVDDGPAARQALSRWPRPDLKMLLVRDFGMIGGATFDDLRAACEAEGRSEITGDRRPLLVAYATFYTLTDRAAVADFAEAKGCDAPF